MESWFLQQWMDQMTAAVQPFVPDHAQQFAEHLHDFLASKLSIAGYDRMVFGESEGPSQAQAQSSSGTSPVYELAVFCLQILEVKLMLLLYLKFRQHPLGCVELMARLNFVSRRTNMFFQLLSSLTSWTCLMCKKLLCCQV